MLPLTRGAEIQTEMLPACFPSIWPLPCSEAKQFPEQPAVVTDGCAHITITVQSFWALLTREQKLLRGGWFRHCCFWGKPIQGWNPPKWLEKWGLIQEYPVGGLLPLTALRVHLVPSSQRGDSGEGGLWRLIVFPTDVDAGISLHFLIFLTSCLLAGKFQLPGDKLRDLYIHRAVETSRGIS